MLLAYQHSSRKIYIEGKRLREFKKKPQPSIYNATKKIRSYRTAYYAHMPSMLHCFVCVCVPCRVALPAKIGHGTCNAEFPGQRYVALICCPMCVFFSRIALKQITRNLLERNRLKDSTLRGIFRGLAPPRSAGVLQIECDALFMAWPCIMGINRTYGHWRYGIRCTRMGNLVSVGLATKTTMLNDRVFAAVAVVVPADACWLRLMLDA